MTSSLSSCRSWVVRLARDVPTLASSTKKLFPRSALETFFPSTTVNAPAPGSTRFLTTSVPTAEPLTSAIRAPSSSACPCSAHNLQSKMSAQHKRGHAPQLTVVFF